MSTPSTESNREYPLEGGCSCGEIRYQLLRAPLFVHCCHCTWCQRESGAAFALNALIETENLTLLQGKLIPVNTPSASGSGQLIHRCPRCRVALWSHYNGMGPAAAFLRVGTLDQANLLPPDIHIFTSTRQPWVNLSQDVPVMEEYYDRREFWSEESLSRHEKMLPAIRKHRASQSEQKPD
ncbi:hypothetical protein TDB9533_03236 [Thalassocella blandensis]|nr:hypothetical protein TDB9533_03236 [Thalassocella blandensis]